MTLQIRHTIQKLVFTFSIPAKDMAVNVQDRISDISGELVPNILERCINKFDRADSIICIDRIELDLGTIQVDSLESDIEEKLGKNIDECLAERIHGPQQENDGVLITLYTTFLIDQLEYFLFTGQLPWSADVKLFRDIDRMVTDLAENATGSFYQLLQKIVKNKIARMRLIFNLNEETLRHIIKKFLKIPQKDLEDINSVISWSFIKLTRSGIRLHKKMFLFETFFLHFLDFRQHEPVTHFKRWMESEITPDIISSINVKEFKKAAFEEIADECFYFKRMFIQYIDTIGDLKESGDSEYLSEKSRQKDSVGELDKEAGPKSLTAKPGQESGEVVSEECIETGEAAWFVRNSGLIVLWPYLSRYFTTLKLVEDKKFLSQDHQLQAMHELAYLAFGDDEYQEYDLVLNKVLCGLPLSTPVDPEFKLLPTNKKEAEVLLKNAIQNWKIISNTSVAGFRNSFLIREGKLTEQEKYWTLIIDRKGFDVLLDQLPYSINVIKLSWMEKPLYTEW